MLPEGEPIDLRPAACGPSCTSCRPRRAATLCRSIEPRAPRSGTRRWRGPGGTGDIGACLPGSRPGSGVQRRTVPLQPRARGRPPARFATRGGERVARTDRPGRFIDRTAHFASAEFTEAMVLMERAVPALIDAGQFYYASNVRSGSWDCLRPRRRIRGGLVWTDPAYSSAWRAATRTRISMLVWRAPSSKGYGRIGRCDRVSTKAAAGTERVGRRGLRDSRPRRDRRAVLRDGDAARAAIAFEASADLAAFCDPCRSRSAGRAVAPDRQGTFRRRPGRVRRYSAPSNSPPVRRPARRGDFYEQRPATGSRRRQVR